ncbi:MAG: ribosome maturation factor RimP [Proteobacteria bacterium]|nr:ribosome maturation factor RimP [Pseudomonadota bacterium]
MTSPLEQQVSTLAAQALAAHGLVLVQARLSGVNGRLTLQVFAENPNGTAASLEDCTQASRTLSAQMDVADLIKSRYTLEVGSPGAERPLTSAADCLRFVGRHARFQFHGPQQFPALKTPLGAATGFITEVKDEAISLAINSGTATITFPFKMVRNAELNPTEDELNQLIKNANLKQNLKQ